jgi:hypothetical protein
MVAAMLTRRPRSRAYRQEAVMGPDASQWVARWARHVPSVVVRIPERRDASESVICPLKESKKEGLLQNVPRAQGETRVSNVTEICTERCWLPMEAGELRSSLTQKNLRSMA